MSGVGIGFIEQIERNSAIASSTLTKLAKELRSDYSLSSSLEEIKLIKQLYEGSLKIQQESPYAPGVNDKETAPLLASKGSWGYPVPNGAAAISSYFGYRIHPILKKPKLHTGIDFGNGPSIGLGKPVYATRAGTIIIMGWIPGYGKRVEIQHEQGIVSTYSHNSGFIKGLTVGSQVKKGQVIALLGSTGYSTGVHCHFEIKINGDYVDPLPFLQGKK